MKLQGTGGQGVRNTGLSAIHDRPGNVRIGDQFGNRCWSDCFQGFGEGIKSGVEQLRPNQRAGGLPVRGRCLCQCRHGSVMVSRSIDPALGNGCRAAAEVTQSRIFKQRFGVLDALLVLAQAIAAEAIGIIAIDAIGPVQASFGPDMRAWHHPASEQQFGQFRAEIQRLFRIVEIALPPSGIGDATTDPGNDIEGIVLEGIALFLGRCLQRLLVEAGTPERFRHIGGSDLAGEAGQAALVTGDLGKGAGGIIGPVGRYDHMIGSLTAAGCILIVPEAG